MAHCSDAERLFAVRVLEETSAEIGFDYHEVFDKLLEGTRHCLLELIPVLWPHDGENLYALRDLLTSLKHDSGECILSGQVDKQCMSFQDAISAESDLLRQIRFSSQILATMTLPTGAARTGLIWLQTQHRVAYQDRDVAPLLCDAGILSIEQVQTRSDERPQLDRLLGASFVPGTDGSYRSCAQYFSAVVKHQERELRIPVSDLLSGLIRDCKRSILRGLGPEQLKDSFDVWSLRPLLQESSQIVEAWSAEDLNAMTDATLIAVWFMLREVELSNIRRSHLYVEGSQLFILLAVYKTGKDLPKSRVVACFRSVLQAAGVPLTRPDESGVQVPRFHGHCARVSGAQWLISLHLALHLVMLLGRWSSAAIYKYVQSTPLLQLPSATHQVFQGIAGDAVNVQTELHGAASLAASSAASQPDNQAIDLTQELATLQEEVSFLKKAASEPPETLVRSVRSLLVHRIRVNEKSNPPRKWKTVCGWPYGLRNFMRVPPEEDFDLKTLHTQQISIIAKDRCEAARANLAANRGIPGPANICLSCLSPAFSFFVSRVNCSLRNMTSSSAEPSMDEIAAQAGAGEELKRYLRERGLTSTGAFSMVAQGQDQFDACIVAPLLSGWQPDPAVPALTIPEPEKPIARAILRFMWTLAREARARAASSAAPAPAVTASPVAGTLTLAACSTEPAKVPKHLPPGEWRKMIDRYNAVLINGEARLPFPEQELLGAESVVARVLYEHRTSKLYCPVGLGEVLQRRSFQSNGEVNPLAKRARSSKLSVEDGVLKEEAVAEDEWVPRGYMSVMDGLNSIRWLYVLCEIGSETAVHAYFDSMIKRSRTRNVQVEQFKAYFEKASWRLCAMLRANKTWKEASEEILNDVTAFQEALMKEPTVPSPNKRKLPVPDDSAVDAATWIPAKKGKGSGIAHGMPIPGMLTPVDDFSDRFHGQDDPEPNIEPSAEDTTGVDSGAAAHTAQAIGCPPFCLQLPPLENVRDVIVLSMFDGMGSSAFALQQLGVRIRALFTWEVDIPANRVSKSIFKGLRFERGDITQDDPRVVANMILDMDAGAASPILVLAGPPCPDFSKVANGQGRSGPTGKLFQVFCLFLQTLEGLLLRHSFHVIVENVVMNRREDVDFFSQQLGASPTLLCSSDFGIISRPRLFWTRLDFAKVKTNPITGQPMRWSRQNGHARLFIDPPKDQVSQFQMKGLEFHSEVKAGRRLLPCLTTPASSDAGRDPPRGMRGTLDPEVKRRWLQAGRQYAPWHYEATALVTANTGEQTTLPVELKEQAHHYRPGITRLQNITPRDRRKMLGNSWHIGVIKFLLWLVLSQVVPASSCSGANSRTNDHSLQELFQWARREPLTLSREVPASRFICLPPSDSEWEHWLMTAEIAHPLLAKPKVGKALQLVYERLRTVGDGIQSLRESVLQTLGNFVREHKHVSDQWFASLPSHVQSAYRLSSDQEYVQIPAFVALLQGCGYPEVEALEAELSQGMPMIGRIRPTPGWLPRTDSKYSAPISFEAFQSLNEHHVRERLTRHRVDDEWETMLSEVITEVRAGRMEGPFRAPPGWKQETVPVAGVDGFEVLSDCPDLRPCIAWAFSVVQEGSDGKRKVRRCEDYRRSFHNDTVQAFDIPPHDDIGVYVSMVRHLHASGEFGMIWAQDLHSAYRQYPVRSPSHCYVIVMTPDGPTLWRHRVMPFGATASVFHFNKVTDALLWLARTLLVIPAIHYVDDLGSVDPASSAQSSFTSFDAFCSLLGFQLKPSKRQPPDRIQKLQGVIVQIGDQGVTVAPSESRVRKLVFALRRALSEDSLSPDEAARLAGKLGFLSTSLWGQVGQSLTRPLHGRAHGPKNGTNALNSGLRACMQCLIALISNPVPRLIPFAGERCGVSVLYADAYFKLGDKKWSVASDSIPTSWPANMHLAENGWGFICRASDRITAGHGSVPPRILRLFGSRRSYIYFLEIFSQAVCLLANHDQISPFWVSFCDNRAGLAALRKGYGKDESINRFLSWFHALCIRLRWHGHFEWVSSQANLSDKVSRGDLRFVRSQGWPLLQDDLSEFWAVVERIAADSEFATGAGVEAALASRWLFQSST
ncbi:unnamed protein product [Symbiodinium sp. CCMP2592]|nr:unnamed protein product [Symbiodinium sp. CCMP2592]